MDESQMHHAKWNKEYSRITMYCFTSFIWNSVKGKTKGIKTISNSQRLKMGAGYNYQGVTWGNFGGHCGWPDYSVSDCGDAYRTLAIKSHITIHQNVDFIECELK